MSQGMTMRVDMVVGSDAVVEYMRFQLRVRGDTTSLTTLRGGRVREIVSPVCWLQTGVQAMCLIARLENRAHNALSFSAGAGPLLPLGALPYVLNIACLEDYFHNGGSDGPSMAAPCHFRFGNAHTHSLDRHITASSKHQSRRAGNQPCCGVCSIIKLHARAPSQ
jgi:hypothetical protein